MSFAIKHRDIEREWENRGGVVVIFLNNGRFLLTLRRCMPANILERMRRQIYFQYYYSFGASLEQMSNGARGAWLTSRIALLVCFIVLVLFTFV